MTVVLNNDVVLVRLPHLLFPNDLEKLLTTGKSEEECIQHIEINGKKFKALKKKRNSNVCIFWDEEKEKCSVYNKRPFEWSFSIFSRINR